MSIISIFFLILAVINFCFAYNLWNSPSQKTAGGNLVTGIFMLLEVIRSFNA